jgi:Ca-activated chloride channel family protein
MVSLAHPSFLLLLLALPAIAWLWLRRRRSALPYPDLRLVQGLPSGRARFARRVGTGLRLAGLATLVLAAAGPRWPDLRTRIEPEGIALMMVVDVSGSMAEPDFTWKDRRISRLEAAQRVFRLFTVGGTASDVSASGNDTHFEGRPTDLMGLVIFGTHPECICPLTLSHGALLQLLEAQRPRSVPGESETNLSDAVALALERLHGAAAKRKVLILLSDGEHNVPGPESQWSPRQAAQVAAGLGIPIYTIDTGSESEAGTEQADLRQAGAQTLADLARISKGQSFAARDSASLLNACHEIDRLERAPIASYQYRRYHEAYPWLGLAALLSFAAALGLERTVWRQLP